VKRTLILSLWVLLLVPLLMPAALAAQEVQLVSPQQGQPTFGDVEMAAVIRPQRARVERVEFYVDGVLVASIDKPPYRVVVDVGQENVEHNFEAVAYAPGGGRTTSSVRTYPLQVDDQIDVKLRELYVNVSGNSRPLNREDFAIYDMGVEQEIVTFERGDVPFTAALLVDASSSMAGDRLKTAVSGAESFVRAMNKLDEAKLLLFADRVLLETDFTNVPTVLTLGLSTVEAEGGTALNDAMYLAMKRLEPLPGRKVVVLLSDGVDMESVLGMEEVRAIARGQQVVLYWLRLRREDDDKGARRYSAWRDDEEHKRELGLLHSAIQESGGRILPIDDVRQVASALQTILQELRGQYVLGYNPGVIKGTGTWHPVEVRARGAQVRTLKGYTEP